MDRHDSCLPEISNPILFTFICEDKRGRFPALFSGVLELLECNIVYRVEQDCLKVALIGKRNDDEIYRELKNL